MSIARQIVPNGIAARAIAVNAGSTLVRYEAACRAISEAVAVDEVKDIHDAAKAMAAAARIAKNKQAEADMMEIRFRAERRLGELMAAQRDTVGLAPAGRPKIGLDDNPISKPVTLAEAGIDKNLADRARKYAAVPEKDFEARLADYRQRVTDEGERASADLLAAGDKHVRGTFGTGENEWYTPSEFAELARQVLGAIDLDPASSEQANATVCAGTFFTEADNGLAQPWHGRIWLNPPYAQPAIAQFAEKMCVEREAGNVLAAIVLTHNYTDTAWFQALARSADAICFTRGRVRFVSPSGELAAPTQGQAFFYFGHDVERFAEVFDDVGFVVEVRP